MGRAAGERTIPPHRAAAWPGCANRLGREQRGRRIRRAFCCPSPLELRPEEVTRPTRRRCSCPPNRSPTCPRPIWARHRPWRRRSHRPSPRYLKCLAHLCPHRRRQPASARTSTGELNGSPQVESGPLSVSVSWHSSPQGRGSRCRRDKRRRRQTRYLHCRALGSLSERKLVPSRAPPSAKDTVAGQDQASR